MSSKSNNQIIKLLVLNIKSNKSLYRSFNFSHNRQKYKLSDYIHELSDVLKTGIAWRDIRSHINWNSIYKTYIRLNRYNIPIIL